MKNKNMFKVLATASILAMATMPIMTSAQVATPVAINNEPGIIVNKMKSLAGTMGQITEFVNDRTGKFITVTGHGLAPSDQSEIILSITKDTKIIDSKGNRVPLKSIIDEQKVVKAFYSANITKSLPARGIALTLVVQDQSFTAIDGTVTDVLEDGIMVEGLDIYSSYENNVLLRFADNAQIIDQNGQAIKASEIQKGMIVRAFYGPAVTMSLPPQATTNYVVVNTTIEDPIKETKPGTDGVITNIADHKITVMGNPTENGGVNYVILTVDENTQIISQDGSSLDIEDLKEDIQVTATYGEMMLAIFPAQTHADKIVIKETKSHKVEGTIVASDRISDGQVYVNVGSDESTTNDVVLNISEDTKVVSMDGGETELKAGMIIKAYHSPQMTRSLPGITNAEIVVIMN
ncbi:peptidase [Paenibacillus crassostreae]|uniref:Peptidase n=1 Tax=Paenibacillus crassostreae TaxID=1763538 RepID=A0A167FG23_9BACL|nr:peptidase [Paenibacillus crassostreae]AOZ94441.1 peptidase [Paenibacillus crassostreae]OAB76522.1 peptidase [Paenibacillus crassostreae]